LLFADKAQPAQHLKIGSQDTGCITSMPLLAQALLVAGFCQFHLSSGRRNCLVKTYRNAIYISLYEYVTGGFGGRNGATHENSRRQGGGSLGREKRSCPQEKVREKVKDIALRRKSASRFVLQVLAIGSRAGV
jgi:hypothetical protein